MSNRRPIIVNHSPEVQNEGRKAVSAIIKGRYSLVEVADKYPLAYLYYGDKLERLEVRAWRERERDR